MPKGDFSGGIGYSTHQATLVKYALRAPEGSTIIELGCGNFSTTVLSQIASARKLRYIVYTDDEKWAEVVKPTCLDNIEWNIIENWKIWKPTEDAYFYFLDNSELCVNRFKQIAKIKKFSQFVICHDSCTYTKRGVSLSENYSVIEEDKTRVPHTAVIDCSLQSKSTILTPCVDKVVPDEPMKPIEAPVEALQANVAPSTDKSIKTAVVCCYQPGGDYDSHYLEYIERLAVGVSDNNTVDAKFYCVSIMDLSSIAGVTNIQPLNGNWRGWHIKSEVFREGLWDDYDRVLYIDLDTVICGNIDDILTSTSEFSMLHDFYHPVNQETGIIYFNPKLTQSLYASLLKRNAVRSIKDADLINRWLRIKKIKPDILQHSHKIGSYKVSLIRDGNEWSDYSIICFHGNPRPHHVGWNLDAVADNKALSPPAKKNLQRQAGKKMVIEPIEPIWEGEDVFIIGGGPSIKDLDLDKLLAGFKVLGINDGYKYECCDACFFGDTVWWSHHCDELKSFRGEIYSTSGVHDPTIRHLDLTPVGFTDDKTKLAWNSNSGMAGINLAAHLGAKRIFLLGFDMRFGDDGQPNWHPNIRKVNQNTYKGMLNRELQMVKQMKNLFPELECINVEVVKDWSMMKHLPKVLLDDLLIKIEGE